MGFFGQSRSKDGNLNVYWLSVDAGVYREMK